MSKEILNSACGSAQAIHQGNCSGAARLIAEKMGYILPVLSANGLIDYFSNASNGWMVVNETDAQTAADNGRLVIAGKKASDNGHVVVVMPGGKKASGGYLYTDKKTQKKVLAANHGLYPRSCSTAMGGWPGGVSNGDKTVFDSWGSVDKYKGVTYWLAPVRDLVFQKIKPGDEILTRVPVLKGRVWTFPAACKLTFDLPPGTRFKAGAVHTVEKWVDLVAINLVGLTLRVSAEELISIFKLP